MKLETFDLEVLPNSLVCGIKPIGQDPITFRIDHANYDLKKIVDYFLDGKKVFVGYNCKDYDTPIINMLIHHFQNGDFWEENYLIVTQACKDLSDLIIKGERMMWRKYRYMNYFTDLDLMTMMASKALRVGLKSLQISMCYPNVEEMIIDWESWVRPEVIDKIISYNNNDLGSTEAVLKIFKEDLMLRQSIKKQYGIECMSKDGVGIGVEIVTKYVCEALGIVGEKELYHFRDNYKNGFELKDFIIDDIKFKNPAFNKALETFKGLVLDAEGKVSEDFKTVKFPSNLPNKKKGEKEEKAIVRCKYGNLVHSFGLGGIHSENKPQLLESDSKYILIDCDVASMYPAMAIAWSLGPKGFKEVFVQVLRMLREKRLIAKREGDKITDKTFKLALNSILGHLRNIYSPYFAPEANAAICINGQLFLAMLIERLEDAGIEVVMSNTDGLTSKVRRDKLEEYYTICKEWEKVSRLELEYVEYEKMAIWSVNNYVAYVANKYDKKTDKYLSYSDVCNQYTHPNPEDILEFNFAMIKNTGDGWKMLDYEKQKGDLLTYPRLGKGLNSLIVAKAVINYLGKGTPIEETVKNFKSIYDYVTYQKVGKQFSVEWGGEETQHISRFYVSKTGKRLLKVSADYGAKKKYHNLIKGYDVEIVNDLRGVDINDPSNFNVNYQYYITKARAMVEQVEPSQLTLF